MRLLHVIVFMATSFIVSTQPACPFGDIQNTCAPGFFYYVDATNYGACYVQEPSGSATSNCAVAHSCSGNPESCGGGVLYSAHCQGDCAPLGTCHCDCYLNYPDQNIYTLDHWACYDGNWDGVYPGFPIGPWINGGTCSMGWDGTNPNPLQCCFWKDKGQSGTEICFEGSMANLDIINFNDEISSYQCSDGIYAVLWYDANYGGASSVTADGGSASYSSGDYWNDEISSVQICQVINSNVCGNWYNAYQVTSTVGGIQIPVKSGLKSAPQNIQTWWNQYDCNHKMCGYLKKQNGILSPYTVNGESTSSNPWIPLYEMLQCPALLYYSLIYEGCYVDSSNRYFKGPSFQQQYMSVETCFLLCNNLTQSYPYTLSYPFFGVEDGNQCFCGSSSAGTAVSDPFNSLCGSTCSGNLDQKCGGFWYISVYKAVGLRYEGCFADSTTRYLTGPTETSGSYMSVEACFQFCNPNLGTIYYPYIGVEYGNQCYCGITSAGTAVADPSQTLCGYPCLGNPTQMCGGSWYISVYSYINSDVCASWLNTYDFYNAMTLEGLTWGQSEAPAYIQTLWNQYDCDHKICFYWKSSMGILSPYTLPSSAGVAVAPYNHFGCPILLNNNLLYQGCFVDSSTRYLNGPSFTVSPMSVEICFLLCNPGRLYDYQYIGVEEGNQCFCSLTLNPGVIDQNGCNQVCSGNLDQSCGGYWRISVWMVVWGVSASEESEAVEEVDATYSGVQMSVAAIAGIVVGAVVVVVVAIIGVVMFRRYARVSKVDDSKVDDSKVDNVYPLME